MKTATERPLWFPDEDVSHFQIHLAQLSFPSDQHLENPTLSVPSNVGRALFSPSDVCASNHRQLKQLTLSWVCWGPRTRCNGGCAGHRCHCLPFQTDAAWSSCFVPINIRIQDIWIFLNGSGVWKDTQLLNLFRHLSSVQIKRQLEASTPSSYSCGNAGFKCCTHTYLFHGGVNWW